MKIPQLLLIILIFIISSCTNNDNNNTTNDGGLDSDIFHASDIQDVIDGGDDKIVWCNTQWPHYLETAAGNLTEKLYAQIQIQGVTPANGTDSKIKVELGFGPLDQNPWNEAWNWSGAEFNSSCSECTDNTEEYMGKLTPLQEGSFLWAARVKYNDQEWIYCDRSDETREGSLDGWSKENAPTLVVVDNQISVVSLNLRCLLDDWDARLPLIVDALTTANPDLIGLQEVCSDPNTGRDNLTELITALENRTGKIYQVTRANTHWSWDTYDEGIALLTPHIIESYQEIELPAGAFIRKLIMGRIITPNGVVVMATTHLEHQDSTVRVNQINSALNALNTFGTSTDSIVLTGDFNESPDGQVHSIMVDGGFSDMWETLHSGIDGFTFPASNPSIRIDYIWLNQKNTPLFIQRILDIPIAGVTGSDHLGVWGLFSNSI
jgi:endonuclease/exonuclease/phosphatase family metal-dependent hydrolase